MNKKVMILGAVLALGLAATASAAGTIEVDATQSPKYTVTYTSENATADQQIVLLVLKKDAALSRLDVDSILYIDQMGTDASGKATFSDFQMKTTTSADIYIGTASGAPVSKEDAITVTGSEVSGTVKLQGRTDHSGATVTLTDKEVSAQSREVKTAADGTYTFSEVSPQNYTLYITMPGYLSYTKTTFAVPETSLNMVSLRGGDTDGDGQVTQDDLSAILSNYLKPVDGPVDIDGDKQVTMDDLSMLLGNYMKFSTIED